MGSSESQGEGGSEAGRTSSSRSAGAKTSKRGNLRRGERTRQRILSAAEELFAERGYEGTTFSAIADQLGIRQPGIFYYFPDKPTLYSAVLAEALGSEINVLSAFLEDLPAEERILIAIDRWVESITRRPTLAKLILQEIAMSSVAHDREKPLQERGMVLHKEIQRALSECANAPVDPFVVLHFTSTFVGTTLCYLAVAAENAGQTGDVQTFQQESIERHTELLRETAKMIITDVRRRAKSIPGKRGERGRARRAVTKQGRSK